MWTGKLWELMSEEDRERELKWAMEKHEALVWFVSHVRQALEFPMNPKARKAIYDSWRRAYGDDRARGPAKFAEACIKGLASLDKLEAMVRNPPPSNV
jgi:hypothetical protein